MFIKSIYLNKYLGKGLFLTHLFDEKANFDIEYISAYNFLIKLKDKYMEHDGIRFYLTEFPSGIYSLEENILYYNDVNVFKFLKNSKVLFMETGSSPFHFAILKKNYKDIEYFLDNKNLYKNCVDENDCNIPIYCIEYLDDEKLIMRILKSYEDIYLSYSSKFKINIFDIAHKKRSKKIINYIIDNNLVDFKKVKTYSVTYIMLLIFIQFEEEAIKLVKMGYDRPNMINVVDQTEFTYAKLFGLNKLCCYYNQNYE